MADDCILLNDDTMLLGSWGKIPEAIRIGEKEPDDWEKLIEIINYKGRMAGGANVKGERRLKYMDKAGCRFLDPNKT